MYRKAFVSSFNLTYELYMNNMLPVNAKEYSWIKQTFNFI
jgi:hypothetical protein